MTHKMLTVVLLGFGSVCGMRGQTAKPAIASQVAPMKAVEDLVNLFEGEMMSAAKAMSAEKYSFTPASLNIPGATFDKVRTFADEVKHVAQSNYLTASAITGTEPTVDVKVISGLKSKDEIMAALTGSFTAVHTAIATITPANENEFVDDIGVGRNRTKESEAAWVAVHGFDHYGQMAEYLRMNGIVPPPPAPLASR